MILPTIHSFLRLTGLLLAVALTVLMAVLFPSSPGLANEPEFFDVPFANNQWNIGRRVDESKLRYCIDRRNPDWELAAAIVEV